MANKQTDEEANVLVTAAKAVGKAAGKVAALTGAAEEPGPAEQSAEKRGKPARPAGGAARAEAEPQSAPPRVKSTGRLVKKNKSRLPRREKKALNKAQPSTPAA